MEDKSISDINNALNSLQKGRRTNKTRNRKNYKVNMNLKMENLLKQKR